MAAEGSAAQGDLGVQGPLWRRGAFAYPRYRRYWLSMVARVFGLQFQFIGIPWLVAVELDRSPIWLGVVGLSLAVPTIVLSVPAGAAADRWDHRYLLLVSQGLTSVFGLVMATLVLADVITIWMVVLWGMCVGSLSALATPSYSAILPRLIEMRAMPSAVALTSSVWNTMRIVGPALAGLLIAVVGTGQAFFVTSCGFALSTVLIASLRLDPVAARAAGASLGMLDGFRYIFGNRLFLATIGLSFFTSLFGQSYQTLLPIFADDILDVGSQGFGFMEAAAGIGGFLGTFAIIKIGVGRYAGTIMLAAAAVFGLFIAGFAGSRELVVSMGLLFAASFAASMYLNIGMTLLQVLVPDELRGRVMGIWSMTWFLVSVGGFPASGMAELFGAPWAVALGALSVSAFAALLFLVSSELRRIPRTAPGERLGATT